MTDPTPTLEARLAKLLPCLDGADWECEKDDLEKCTPCQDRPAILALIRDLLREEREKVLDEIAQR